MSRIPSAGRTSRSPDPFHPARHAATEINLSMTTCDFTWPPHTAWAHRVHVSTERSPDLPVNDPPAPVEQPVPVEEPPPGEPPTQEPPLGPDEVEAPVRD